MGLKPGMGEIFHLSFSESGNEAHSHPQVEMSSKEWFESHYKL
jgi:hypothetical protein